MKKYLFSTFAIVALLFAACGGDDAPTTIPVSGIKLDKSSLSLEIGEKATVTATIAPSDATNKSITWSTANPTIATVSNGVVTGVATGETTLTAKTNDGGYSVTIPVKVVPNAVKVSQIKLVGVPAETEKGRSTTISAVITPADATDMSVTFTSSNPEVATVEFTKAESNYSLALLKAVGNGKATITATANDGSGVKATAEVEVVGVEPTALTINGKQNADDVYAWHGKKISVDIATTPAYADISLLYWDIHTASHTPEGALEYNFSSNKLTIGIEHTTNQSKDDTAYVSAWDSENGSTYYGGINVNFKTLSWLFDARYALEMYKAVEIHPFAGNGNDMQKFNWNKSKYPSGVTFVAYYYTNTLADNVTPYNEGKYSYYDYYIPSSEYTLTSSDESKIKVTKNNDGKSWKIERLNTTDLAAVTLTYKCGEHTQTYTINLIP